MAVDNLFNSHSFPFIIETAQKQGQTGIISCIAVNPADPGMYAAGSYSKTIGLYDEKSGGPEILALGHKGGVTHIKFSNDGTRLYSGGRKVCLPLLFETDIPHYLV